MGVLLDVRDLRTQFLTQDGVVNAVNGVSFQVNDGQTLGIVGESGCGKSVTMLSIMRLIPQPPGKITAGQIMFHDQNLVKLSDEQIRRIRGHKIAMIFQDPMTSLNPVLTIGRQISEALELHLGMNSQQSRARTVELLQLVNIPEGAKRINDYPHQFSGGMRQRVMIAMALSCNPELLIADEPTTALDVTIQAQIIELVRRLQRELGMAVIWITHDLGVVAGFCEQVNVMYAGFIIESAAVRDIYASPQHPYTKGLLGSIPRLDAKSKSKLSPIEGLPPDLIDLPKGCPFAARCSYVQDICRAERPELRPVGDGHRTACWVDMQTGKVVK
jgi:oligopeptide transport system ATP-binding protein